jgi:hypothetical protein
MVACLCQHLGDPFPSPALFDKIGQRFRAAVASFAQANSIPWVKVGKDDRKVEVMRPHLERQAATGRSGVAAIGVAQEFQRVWTAHERPTRTGARQSSFTKADRRVSFYDFYLWDADLGPAFIKVCSYFPTRSSSGPTATSGPSAKPPRPGLPSPSCPTGLGPAPTRSGSRRSATGSGPPPSTSSGSGGLLVCRCRWARRTGLPAPGGSARCGRSRSPAPSCSTLPATPAAFRGAHRRQPRPGPARQRGDHLRPQDPPRHRRHLPDRHRPPRQPGRGRQHLLQAVAVVSHCRCK